MNKPPEATPESSAAFLRAFEGSDARLRAVVERWDELPEPVKAGIVAMVRASDSEQGEEANQ